MWMSMHPQVKVTPKSCWIPCPENDWGGYCDHWAVCGRDAFEAYVNQPLDLLPWKGKKINIEMLLRAGLEKGNIIVKRGIAPMFRACERDNPRCAWIDAIGIAGKVSGGGGEIDPWLEKRLPDKPPLFRRWPEWAKAELKRQWPKWAKKKAKGS